MNPTVQYEGTPQTRTATGMFSSTAAINNSNILFAF